MSYSVLLKLESASESPGCWLEGNLSTNESYRLRMKTKLCSSTLSFRAHSRILFSTLSMSLQEEFENLLRNFLWQKVGFSWTESEIRGSPGGTRGMDQGSWQDEHCVR
nr:uncharacterized protein LOC112424645 isoform X1 [Macaca nemestrina]